MEYFYKETGQINMETNNPQFRTYALYLMFLLTELKFIGYLYS